MVTIGGFPRVEHRGVVRESGRRRRHSERYDTQPSPGCCGDRQRQQAEAERCDRQGNSKMELKRVRGRELDEGQLVHPPHDLPAGDQLAIRLVRRRQQPSVEHHRGERYGHGQPQDDQSRSLCRDAAFKPIQRPEHESQRHRHAERLRDQIDDQERDPSFGARQQRLTQRRPDHQSDDGRRGEARGADGAADGDAVP